MSDIVIRAENLGKQYRIGERESYKMLREALTDTVSVRLRSMAARMVGNPSPQEKPAGNNHFWALKDVSFHVKQGEVLGIIGHNGAGKSTLLKILSRITRPTTGCAELQGRLSSLLEVGTGFHPELTGRENIFLNGAILGMKRDEIERKFDEIVSFAEVEQFMDTPVKRYSSGMYLRLAFSVAAHLEPEILLIDEVLAVGDAAFQKKCLGKMDEVAHEGRTVLFVSHNLAAVQQLTRSTLLLDHGRVAGYGPSEEVIAQYLRQGSQHGSLVYPVENAPRRFPDLKRQVEFIQVSLEGPPNRLIPANESICLRISVKANQDVDRFRFGITICHLSGIQVGTVFGPEILAPKRGESITYRMVMRDLHLGGGPYYCILFTGRGNEMQDRTEFDIIHDVLHFEVLNPLRADGVMSEWLSVWGHTRLPEPVVSQVE